MSSILPLGSQSSQYGYGLEATSPPPELQSMLGGLASMLNVSQSDLQSDLQSGQSIGQVASQAGVSTSSVVQFVEQAIQQSRAANGQQPLSSQALNQVATRMVSGHHHHRSGGGGQSVGSAGSGSSSSSAATPTLGADSIWSETGSSSSSQPSLIDFFA